MKSPNPDPNIILNTRCQFVGINQRSEHLRQTMFKRHPSANESQPPFAVDVTTVQLFELVEAVDQFIGDRPTTSFINHKKNDSIKSNYH